MLRCSILSFCLLLSSCSQQHKKAISKKKQQSSKATKNISNAIDVMHKEMVLIDVPIPLYDTPIYLDDTIEKENNEIVLAYKSSLVHDDVFTFFSTQMERFGWKHLVTFQSHEILMQFESPDRYCSISLRPLQKKKKGTEIYLFIAHKNIS